MRAPPLPAVTNLDSNNQTVQPSIIAVPGFSALNVTALDNNGHVIHIGNVTIESNSGSSLGTGGVINGTSNTPVTPSEFFLADNQSFTIKVPSHWVFNDTYYIFDHWLGIGSANSTGHSSLWKGSATLPLPNGLTNSSTIFSSSIQGAVGSDITKNSTNGQITIALVAIYHPLPDSMFRAYATVEKFLSSFRQNNTVSTLVEGESCCEPGTGLLKLVKIYPDHVIVDTAKSGVGNHILSANLQIGQTATGTECGFTDSLTLLSIKGGTATFMKHLSVGTCTT